MDETRELLLSERVEIARRAMEGAGHAVDRTEGDAEAVRWANEAQADWAEMLDEVDALAARLEAAERERDEAQRGWNMDAGAVEDLAGRVVALEAALRRLRHAVIIWGPTGFDQSTGPGTGRRRCPALRCARAARADQQ